ncbi:MAG: signal peptidase I [Oscillospiraceae bacterium]|nr:signal peptidase I [Candidatus Ruminococcus equi]
MAVKVISSIVKVFTTIVIVLIALMAVLLFGCRAVGVTPYTVLSGSMEPTYHVGSIIYVIPQKPQDIKVGDPITFKVHKGVPATHRVVEINNEKQQFLTKGDANDASDAPVSFTKLIGKPIFTIPYLGYFAGWVSSTRGRIGVIAFTVVFLILLFIPDVLDEEDEDEEDKKGKNKKLPEKTAKTTKTE